MRKSNKYLSEYEHGLMRVRPLRLNGGEHMEMRGRRSARRDERKRQLRQIARLQRQLNEQRRKIDELEHIRDTVLRTSSGSATYEGTCAECSIGVIVREHDTLRCSSCGFRCHL